MLRYLCCLLLALAGTSGLVAQDFPDETIVCRTGAFVLESPLSATGLQYRWERSFDGGASWFATGTNAPELSVSNPDPGVRYRLAYAADPACLADPACRQLTNETTLVAVIPTFSQGLTVCAGDTVFVGSQPLTEAGNHETILETPAGCDSVVTTFLNVLPAYHDLFFVELCPGETFFGQLYNRDTVLERRFVASSGCDSVVTYAITVAFADVSDITGPSAICAGETAELVAPGQFAAYAWSTGADDENTEVATSGTYQLTLTDFTGCQLTLSHELTVTEIIIDSVGLSPPSCPGAETGALSIVASGEADLLYSIDGGDVFRASASFGELPAGDYAVVVESVDGCRAEADVVLDEAPALTLAAVTPEELTIERGDSVSLAVVPDFAVADYHWSARNFLSCNDCADPMAYPPVDLTYTVEAVAAGGCSVRKSFAITVLDNRRLYAPTAFSPNGDDRNDRWRIYTGPRARAVSGLRITDRWGGVRYEQPAAELPPAEAAWDGRDGSGQPLDAGTYLYAATVRFTDGSTKNVSGTITLMR